MKTLSTASMLLSVATVFGLLGAVACRPPIVTPHGNFSTEPLSARDREWLQSRPQHRLNYPAGFHLTYVSHDGRISPNYRPAGDWVKIVGSPQTSEKTLYVAALEVHRMLRLASPHIFTNIARSTSGVGIFTAAETLTVFPEFYDLADTPACRGRCDGACAKTCTFDGRKFSEIAGVTSGLSVVLADNLECTASDPYSHHDNVLVHEFAHTVDIKGLTAYEKSLKDSAFNSAKARQVWRLDTYAMANSAEYFAEATGAYFLVNMQTQGMTDCSYGPCRSEMDARNFINSRDPALYNLLNSVYNVNGGFSASGLTICYRH